MTSILSIGTPENASLDQVNMMKLSLSLTTALLGLAAIAGAAPFTFSDPFNAGSPDVIGALDRFDIQKVVVDVSASGVTADIYMNYGPGNTSIAPYSDYGKTFYIGDLFFTIGGTLSYGVALNDHLGAQLNGGQTGNTVTAGHLYRINDVNNGTLTAAEALNGYSGAYRPDEIVLLRNYSTYLTDLGAGSVNVNATGSNPEFKITVSIPQSLSSSFYSDMNSGNWGIHFASANCGNDIVDGVDPVPEPATLVMFGSALLGLGLVRRRVL